MKKFVSIILAMLLVLGLAACGNEAETTAAAGGSSAADASQSDDEVFVVGICQLVQHAALDSATQGFKDALIEALGDKVEFDEQNASGEAVNCTTIINGFTAKGVDLIMANATPALTAAAAATKEIPILGTSVTSYAAALEIDDFNGIVGGNISGTSDLADLKEQAALFPAWLPEAKTVGLLYCSAEANSIYQVEVVEKELADMGIATQRFAFTDTNDVGSVTQAACDACDALYIPTDNTAASNTEAIANITIPAKTPVIAGEMSICKGCGLATLSIDYYDLGVATGKMAAKILTGEADISTMEIEYAPNLQKYYNAAMCETFGITPLEGYEALTD
ncbi:MAG: ABC transporter substrate-binding protein [Lachnospiraceae bacterium]|nr:ABC transporter substrate-binding protein [Lachnospiraceae bacterium]